MQHQFTEYEDEPQPQSWLGRSGGPPRKHIGVGVLDPPVPPRRPTPQLATPPRPWVIRGFALLILAALAFMLLTPIFLQH
jgi:hypothetical protein